MASSHASWSHRLGLDRFGFRTRLLAAIGVCCLAIVGATLYATSALGAAGNQGAVDIAGRQRMLNQRFVKENLLVAAGHEVNAEATANLFLASGRALLEGGEAPLDPAGGTTISFDPAPEAVAEHLAESLTEFEELVALAASLGPEGFDLADEDARLSALAALQEQSAIVHTAANAATRAFAEEGTRQVDAVRSRVLVAAVGVAAVLALSVTFTVNRATRMLDRARTFASRIAARELTQEPLGWDRVDEFGQLGKALDSVQATLQESITAIGQSADHVADAATGLRGTAGEISGLVAQSAAQAEQATASSATIRDNVDAVSAATGSYDESARDIRAAADEAAGVASTGVEVARSAAQEMSGLAKRSEQISGVLAVITAIAEQTNLLALNATIEAARAGEAGKGFAVVAEEVKQLASETAKATVDIDAQITSIVADVGRAVGTMEQVASVINDIDAIQARIAEAVERQGRTTGEVAEGTRHAAEAATLSAGAVAVLADGVRTSETSAGSVSTAAVELAALAEELRQRVRTFDLGS